MATKIRVLVVDDSVVMRRILADVISCDPELEVAGYAANGQIALALMNQVSPDIVILDVEMPVMNGLATLKAMRVARHTFPVIMFSTLTERGAEATIDSLALGASDYVAKPTDTGSYDAARERIREALVPKIKSLCRRSPLPTPSIVKRTQSKGRSKGCEQVEVLVIGSSTGGPNALSQILPEIPPDFPVPVLIVQHMPPAFTRFLAQRLTGLCRLPAQEAVDGEILKEGKIWIAPGDYHMSVARELSSTSLRVVQGPAENSCRPSVDVLFRSVAEEFSNRALAVVLTGMGQDGLRGCERLADVGAQIIVQDEPTSVVWGMPGFVARAGLADAILPLPEIGAAIVERVSGSRPVSFKRVVNATVGAR